MYRANNLYRLIDVNGYLVLNVYGVVVQFKTESEAIAGATELITSGRYASVYLMKMVKAISKSTPPVTIEDVEPR